MSVRGVRHFLIMSIVIPSASCTGSRVDSVEILPNEACQGTGGPSVLVIVRGPGGEPAAAGTTIVITDGDFRDSLDYPLSAWTVGAGERRPGTYEVRLTKPGYEPIMLHDVQAPGDERCRYAEPTDIRRVRLRLLPNAKAVRSVFLWSSDLGLGLPHLKAYLRAIVDADRGVSHGVAWSSSDTTVATVSRGGVVRSQCRAEPGAAWIVAASLADPGVRDSVRAYVSPPPDDVRGIGPPAAAERAAECRDALRRLGRPASG